MMRPPRFLKYATLATLLLTLAPTLVQAQDYTSNIISYWNFDETSGSTFADQVGSNDGTWTDGVDNDFSGESVSGYFGNGILLDGVDDRINFGSNASIDSVVPLTVCMWVNPVTFGSGYKNLITKSNNGGSDGWDFYTGSGAVGLSTWNGGYKQPGGLATGSWQHVCVTWDGSAGPGGIDNYLDGTHLPNAGASWGASGGDDANALVLGQRIGGSLGLNGNFDELRVYNRKLTDADIAALYAATSPTAYTCATPNGLTGEINFNDDNRTLQYCNATNWVSIGKPAISNTGLVGHWKMDETSGSSIADSSDNGNNGTWSDGINDDVTEETSTGQVGTTINFDGVDDNINAGSDNSLDNMSAFTLTVWMNANSEGGNDVGRIFSKSNWALIASDTGRTNALTFYITDTGFSNYLKVRAIDNSWSIGTWHHVVMAWNGGTDVANDMKLYIDGTEVAYNLQDYDPGTRGDDSGANLLIGEHQGQSWNFDGELDDARIYNRALSATEIADMYNAQTANCSAPTSNLVGHWTLDETSGSTIADSSGNSNNGTWTDGANNDVTEETLAGQNGTAIDFDGADNIITVPHAATLDISSGYTVSSWVYFDSTQTGGIFPAIISKNNSGGWGSGWVLGRSSAGGNISGGKVRLAVYHNRDINVPNAAYSNWIYPVDTWNYVTVSWDGNNVNYYLNGVLLETEIITTPPDTGSGDLNIGYGRANWYSAYHDGQIDDVRLYDRALSDTEIAALYGGTGGACSVSTCASPFAPKATLIFNTDYDVMQYCNGSNWIAMGPQGNGGAGCSNPSGLQAELIYNQDLNILQYCEGDEWIAMTPKLGTQLASGLIGHWTLDETSGNVIADSSGNGNDGTWVDSADNDVTGETTVGTVGTALTFDGTDDYIDISATAAGTGSYEDWTISTWYKSNTTTISDDQYITVFGDPIGGNNDVFLIAVGDDAGYEKAIRVFLNSNPSSGSNYYGTSDVNDMNWHHIVVTRNKAVGGDINIYVDGVLESNNEVADDIENYTFTIAGHSYIGDDPGATETVNGILDDVRLYNRTLSASEVTALYDIGTPPADIASGLAGHWTLDETSGGVIADSSGNGNNGTWIDGTNNDVTEETTTGTVNTTFTFDGTDDYIDVGAGINFTGEQSFTLNTWVYFDNDPLTRTSFFISKRNNYWLWWNGVGEFGLADNALIFGLRDGSFQDMVEAPWTPNANQWYLLTAIYDANADTASIYVDGTLLLQETGQNYAMAGSAYGLELGQHYNDNRRIEGSLDDIRIYDRALSSAEVNALYNLGTVP